MPSNQPSDQELLIEEVYAVALAGGMKPDIERHLREQGKPVTKDQLNDLINQKDKILEDAVGDLGNDSRAKLIREHVMLGRSLFARSFHVEDYRTCASILAAERELLGLNAPKKVESERPPLTLIFNEIVIQKKSDYPALLPNPDVA